MCIALVEVKAVATEEEKKILFNDEGYWNFSDFGTKAYDIWAATYNQVSREYYNRRNAQRLEALRIKQEKELAAKERELFRVAKAYGFSPPEKVYA